jgi:hypothetical protein
MHVYMLFTAQQDVGSDQSEEAGRENARLHAKGGPQETLSAGGLDLTVSGSRRLLRNNMALLPPFVQRTSLHTLIPYSVAVPVIYIYNSLFDRFRQTPEHAIL